MKYPVLRHMEEAFKSKETILIGATDSSFPIFMDIVKKVQYGHNERGYLTVFATIETEIYFKGQNIKWQIDLSNTDNEIVKEILEYGNDIIASIDADGLTPDITAHLIRWLEIRTRDLHTMIKAHQVDLFKEAYKEALHMRKQFQQLSNKRQSSTKRRYKQ